MDVCTDFDRLVREMEWGDVVSTLEDVLTGMLKVETESALDPLLSPPPPPPPLLPGPPVPESSKTVPKQTDILNGGHGGSDHRSTVPQYFEEPSAPEVYIGQAPMDPEPFYSQNAMWSHDVYNQEALCNQGQYDNVPVLGLPEHVDHSLRPVGYLNGEVLYEIPANSFAPPDFAASPSNMFLPNGFTQHVSQLDEDRPYVKKPLNAFMIFRKEQRQIVMDETNIRDSASVNAIVGKKWKSLTKEEQTRYFIEAEKERLLHALQHPNWSFKHNYGKRKLRNRKNNRKGAANVKKATAECMTASFAALVPPAVANQAQTMLIQHLQPNHSASPPLQFYQDFHTVDFEQIQIQMN